MVVATQKMNDGVQLLVVPVTHTGPEEDDDAVEMPRSVKRNLSLDDARSWIVVTELNRFAWPGPDVRPVPAGDGTPLYGAIPAWLFERVRDRVVALAKGNALRITKRSE